MDVEICCWCNLISLSNFIYFYSFHKSLLRDYIFVNVDFTVTKLAFLQGFVHKSVSKVIKNLTNDERI